MNLQGVYNNIVSRSKSLDRKKGQGIYFEEHHILPVCLGGSNSKENLVLLTAKEHFICHKLLSELHPFNNKVFYAFFLMATMKNHNQQRDYKISSKEYERLKMLNRDFSSELHKGKKVSKVTILKIKESKDKKPDIICPHCGKVGRNTGMKRYHFDNCNYNPNNINSDEIFICPHCNKEGKGFVMKQHHFDNCLKNPNVDLIKINKSKESFSINMSKKLKSKPVIKCPYCSVESNNESNMKRYHFNNCKYRKLCG